jgi:hypothetical protein
MGVIPQRKSLAAVERLAASAFCRRRLPVVMVRLKMAETLREAVTFVEQGEKHTRERFCFMFCQDLKLSSPNSIKQDMFELVLKLLLIQLFLLQGIFF